MEDFGWISWAWNEQIDQQLWTEKNDQNNQAELIRIREGNEKAKKVAQQIQTSKQTNHKFADFVSFLIKNIKEEKIISWIYQVFFKTKNPKDNIKYLKKNINFLVISWIFAPFYPQEIKHFGLFPYYENLFNFNDKVKLETYLSYLKKLSKSYHDNIPIDKNDFLNFIIELFFYYKLSTTLQLETIEDKNIMKRKLYKYIEQQLF